MRVVHFLHIPRSGGIALLRALLSTRPAFYDVGFPDAPMREALVSAMADPHGVYLVHGHTTAWVEDQIPEVSVASFTVLREPRERFVSEFLWQFRRHPLATDLEAMKARLDRWIGIVECGNHEVRLLMQPFAQRLFADAHLTPFDSETPLDFEAAVRALQRFTFVAFTDHLGQAFPRACNLLETAPEGWPMGFRNASPSSKAGMVDAILADPLFRHRIAGLTEADQDLYHLARSGCREIVPALPNGAAGGGTGISSRQDVSAPAAGEGTASNAHSVALQALSAMETAGSESLPTHEPDDIAANLSVAPNPPGEADQTEDWLGNRAIAPTASI